MTNNPEVLLSSTLHDPNGIFKDKIEPAGDIVLQNYRCWIINTTVSTHQEVKDTIKSLSGRGIYFSETDPSVSIATDPVENDHLFLLAVTLRLAQTLNARKIQYTDGDRMIVAALHFQDDFRSMALVADNVTCSLSYLNFRRSHMDYFTHHPPLVQTELEFNRFYSEVFGIPIDIGSTSHIMSIDVLQAILERSNQMRPVSFPHPKWLLIAKEVGANITSAETENVLTFETPEQFRDEIIQQVDKGDIVKLVLTEHGVDRFPLTLEDINRNYSLLQQVYMATLGLSSTLSEREWDLRFNTQRQYLELLESNLPIFKFDNHREEDLRRELKAALTSLEGRRKIILKALSNPSH